MSVVYIEVSRQVEQRRRLFLSTPSHTNMSSVWVLPAALLLPQSLALGLVFVIYTYLWVRVWRNLDTVRVYRSIYNAAVVSITCVAISGTLELIGPVGNFGSSAASSLVSALVAIAVYWIVNTALVAAAILVSGSSRKASDLLGSFSDNVLEFATLGLGAVTAALVVTVPLLALIVLPAVFLLQHQALIRQLVEAATIDSKTELLNAAAWRQLAQRELERAERQHTMTAVLVIDMDRFKHINDAYGHLAGDTALKAVGEALADELRGYDAVGRFGGEEFVALLPGVDGPTARGVAERIRRRIEALTVEIEQVGGGSGQMTVTASIGVAAAPGASADLDDLLRAADGALYVAKDEGRNTVRLTHAAAPSPRDFRAHSGHRAGLAEQIALAVIASEVGEHIALLGTLDALTDNLGVQRLRERHDLRDDGPRALVIDEIRDE